MSQAARHPSERRPARGMPGRGVWLSMAAIVAVLGVAVSAALRLFAIPDASPVVLPLPARVGTDTLASPASGTTGTIALPPEPSSALPNGYATGIVPARPFLFGGAGALDRGRALDCLATAIYYEAASEPDDGQRAVAQVVLNRVRHPAFPGTVCGVVFQGARAGAGCQFSFACDGAMARAPSRAGWLRAIRIASAALGGQVFAPVGLATHYHTFAVTPAWNRTLVMTDAIGAHFFHRWKGYWGTPLAFTRVYHGGEPAPLSWRPAAPQPAAPIALATPAATASHAAQPLVQPEIQPAHTQSGQAVTTAEAGSRLPDSPVLDRWKDAGQPLR